MSRPEMMTTEPAQRWAHGLQEAYFESGGSLYISDSVRWAGPYPCVHIRHPKYGAKADGVTADDAALDAAVADALSANVPLYFDPGTYLLKKTHSFAAGSNFLRWDAATRGVELKAHADIAGTTPMVTISGNNDPILGPLYFHGNNINVPLLKVAGNNAMGGGLFGTRFYNYAARAMLQLSGSGLSQFTLDGLLMQGYFTGVAHLSYGIELAGVNDPTNLTLRDCRIWGCKTGIGQAAGHLNGTVYNIFGGSIDDCIYGINLGTHHMGVNAFGTRFEVSTNDLTAQVEVDAGNTASYGIYASGGVATETDHWQGLNIQGCYFTGLKTAAERGIFLQGVRGVQLIGNTAKGKTGGGDLGVFLSIGTHIHKVRLQGNIDPPEDQLGTAIEGNGAGQFTTDNWTTDQVSTT